ncbi:hypothetical protein BH23ACT9_BH23ACT9_33370 [soil metagenome]
MQTHPAPPYHISRIRLAVVVLLSVCLAGTGVLPVAALTRPNAVHAGDAQNARRAADVGPRNLGVEWVTNGSEVDDYRVGGIEGGTGGEAYGLLVHDGLVIGSGTKDGDSSDQATFAFDSATGDVVWITAGVGGGCKPAIDDDGTLWSMAREAGNARVLVALDPATGELDPDRRLEVLPSGPSVQGCSYAIHIASNGLVVFFNDVFTDVLVAVDPATAEVVWEAPAERSTTDVLMTDPTTGDLITTATVGEDATVFRIDPDDGSLLDTITLPGREVHGQFVTDDGDLIVVTTAQFGTSDIRTQRVDLATGAAVWTRTDIEGETRRFGNLALGGANRDLVVGWIGGGSLTALNITNGSTAWVADTPGLQANSSILVDAAGTNYVSLFAPNEGLTFAAVAADGTFLGGATAEEVGSSRWVGALDDEGRLFATGQRDGGLTNWLALTDVGAEIVPGEPGVSRIEGDDPIGSICQVQRPDPDSARSVLLARRDIFADALAGAPLAGDDSCILFTTGGPDTTTVDPVTAAEIDRVLPPGGLIRILGGTNAVSAAVETQLRTAGYTVERFAGDSRYETALAIARQVRIENPGNTDIMLAFAGNWPDAVTGGAYAAFTGTPIVLTDPGSTHPTATAAARELGVTRTFVLGGTAVISDTAAAGMPDPRRISGPTRMATAVAVATDLWAPLIGTPTSFTVVNLERDDAYSLALAAAPLSAALGGPQLGVGNAGPTTNGFPAETEAYLRGVGFTELPAAVLVGDVGLINEGVATAIQGTIQP